MKCGKSRRWFAECWKIAIYSSLDGEVVSTVESAMPWRFFLLLWVLCAWLFVCLLTCGSKHMWKCVVLAFSLREVVLGPTSGALDCLGGGCRSCENWCPLHGQVTVPADVGGVSNLLSSKLVQLNMGEVWRVALLCWQPLMPCWIHRVPRPSRSED